MEQDKSYVESMLALQQSQATQNPERGGTSPQAEQVELDRLLAQQADLTSR